MWDDDIWAGRFTGYTATQLIEIVRAGGDHARLARAEIRNRLRAEGVLPPVAPV